ncbi:hypothetical protein EVAR_74394_1 [Eumeta japonica]|uniref:Histone-lysine N-methyltransferase SETMAR n=1 Tax=Eumeta variegata TaxID=151549 RepID=A0A4C1SDD7_EUMVA|nr:hypothetical protein EVAR_74394_1 [Eumeta japonica]
MSELLPEQKQGAARARELKFYLENYGTKFRQTFPLWDIRTDSEFNRGWSMPTDELKEGRPKSVVVPQHIDAIRELIMQDGGVAYREIKASLGISMMNIHNMLRENLVLKKHELMIDAAPIGRLMSIGAKK